MENIGADGAIQLDGVLLLIAGIVVLTAVAGWIVVRMGRKLRRTWRGTALYTWIAEALRSSDPLVRRMAVGRLASYQNINNDARVATVLMQAVEDPDEDVRAAALDALLPLASQDSTVGLPLARLVRADPNDTIRLRAVRGMAQLTSPPPSSISALLEALKHDSSPEVRLEVVRVLEREEIAGSIPATPLIRSLDDENSAVRQAVTQALERRVRSRPDLLSTLALVIRRGPPRVRLEVLNIVQSLGAATPEILDACLHTLWNEGGTLHTKAVHTLAQLARQHPSVLAQLAKAARSGDRSQRLDLIIVLQEAGQGTTEVVETLLEALADIDIHLSETAQETLHALDFQDREAVHLLLEGLRGEAGPLVRATLEGLQPSPVLLQELENTLTSGPPEMRRVAAATLVALGHAIPELIDYLLPALQDPVSRDEVRDALAQLVQSDEELLTRIAAGLDHENPRVRQETVALLEHLGHQKLSVTPYLLRTLQDPEVQVREGAMDALLALHPNGEVLAQTLLEFLPTAEPEGRERVVELLAELARRNATGLKFLEKIMRHPRAIIREGAVSALGQIEEVESVSILMEALDDVRSQVRLETVRALTSLAPRFPEARDGLERALEDRNGYVRRAAIQAWVEANDTQIGTNGSDFYLPSRLIRAVGDESALVRQAAVQALGELGDVDNENVVDALARALQDQNEDVRRAAAVAFDQVMGMATFADLPRLRSQLEPLLNSHIRIKPPHDLEPVTLDTFVEKYLERLEHSPGIYDH